MLTGSSQIISTKNTRQSMMACSYWLLVAVDYTPCITPSRVGSQCGPWRSCCVLFITCSEMFQPEGRITSLSPSRRYSCSHSVATDGLRICQCVAERAIAIWPNIGKYVTAVTTKTLRNPQTASYDTVAAAQNDGLILAKLHYILALSRSFAPILTKYQTDAPMMPELVKSVPRRFFKKEHLK